jgi:hypothetical protein
VNVNQAKQQNSVVEKTFSLPLGVAHIFYPQLEGDARSAIVLIPHFEGIGIRHTVVEACDLIL